jgi:pimeloyl-ACP methyl ester carboxylesterase
MRETRRTIEVLGRKVFVREAGAGPKVLALHCSSSHSGQWKPLMAELSDRARIVAPDLHGYGQSAPFVPDGSAMLVHDTALVGALIDESGGKVHLVGHSLGAATAVSIARERPQSVASMVLIEPVLFALLDEADLPEAADGWWIAARVHGLLRLGLRRQAAETFVDFWSGDGTWAATEPRIQQYIEDTIDRVADDWAGMVQSLPTQIRLSDLPLLQMPTLLIRGLASRASAQRIVGLLDEIMPDTQLVELPEMSHMAAVTHPEKVMPFVVDWVDGQTEAQD